jgi:hypothetical protein
MRQAALALLTVLLLAACGGGGGGSSSRLSKSEFDSKANAICDEYLKKIDAVPQPTGTKDIVSYIGKVLPILEEGVGKLDDLQPPKDLESTVAEWKGIQNEEVDQAKKLKAAAEKGDLAEVTKIAQNTQTTNKRGNELATQIGATTCAQD